MEQYQIANSIRNSHTHKAVTSGKSTTVPSGSTFPTVSHGPERESDLMISMYVSVLKRKYTPSEDRRTRPGSWAKHEPRQRSGSA